MLQVSQSDCQCFDSLVFRLYGQGALLGTRLPVLMEITALGCWKLAFIGGRFTSHTSPDSYLAYVSAKYGLATIHEILDVFGLDQAIGYTIGVFTKLPSQIAPLVTWLEIFSYRLLLMHFMDMCKIIFVSSLITCFSQGIWTWRSCYLWKDFFWN